MQVSGVSSTSDYYASSATRMKGAEVQAQIQVSVMKKMLDQQEIAGQALVRMIQSAPGAPGSRVDIRA